MATTADMSRYAFDDKLFKAYEDGKHRRYSLLFAVNGGAFTVAKLPDEKGTAGIGKMTMGQLALGMIVFTGVMTFDILAFGLKMRKLEPDQRKRSIGEGLFALPGQIVLVVVGLLISIGWLSVYHPPPPEWWEWAVPVVVCLLFGVGWGLLAFGGKDQAQIQGDTMQADISELIRLNEKIGELENVADDVGNLEKLKKIMAPTLAFRRRDEKIVGLDGYQPKPGKRVTQIESVQVYVKRAVVTCKVTDGAAVTHNIRLFVKVDGKWRLLGWANEE
ncbi:MAG TPA: hypothetical protein VMZ71_02555, partial [Gemmataceae bacterium]|nr:hypothetical protein [Gemmataceae bacterium]